VSPVPNGGVAVCVAPIIVTTAAPSRMQTAPGCGVPHVGNGTSAVALGHEQTDPRNNVT
jgi:hypothetical protein